MGSIRVGTSGWSYKDWDGVFYPSGTAAGDYLRHYAGRFDMVEVDATYYRVPARRTVAGWAGNTPDTFRFTVKAPAVITHEKALVECEAERDEFLSALEPLGPKLHSILLQFGYFNRSRIATPHVFFDRLDRFLERFPEPKRLAVEIRNKNWLGDDFFCVLKKHDVAFAVAEHVWMPSVERVLETYDCVTTDFVYLRLIGDRRGIEEISTTWDKVVVDRKDKITSVVRALADVLPRADVVAFINNHFAGHAPASVADFLDAMAAEGLDAGERHGEEHR